MNKPRGFIHIDKSRRFEVLVIGRARIPLSFIAALYGILTFLLIAVTFALAMINGYAVEDSSYYIPTWAYMLPVPYALAVGLFGGFLYLLADFIEWSVKMFKLARDGA